MKVSRQVSWSVTFPFGNTSRFSNFQMLNFHVCSPSKKQFLRIPSFKFLTFQVIAKCKPSGGASGGSTPVCSGSSFAEETKWYFKPNQAWTRVTVQLPQSALTTKTRFQWTAVSCTIQSRMCFNVEHLI